MAGTVVGQAIIQLDVDGSNEVEAKVGKSMGGIQSTLMKTGAIMSAAITAPVVLMGKAMITAASDYQESLNKVQVAFGDSSKSVEDFASKTLSTAGIAKGSALEMASLFGDMGTSMGLPQTEMAKMSTNLVQLAGDLASFKNVNIDQVQGALAGIFTGETESLKRLGIVMTETNVEAYAMSQGITKSYSEMSQAEKVALRYEYVMNSTKNAQGDFARTSDGTANSTRTFQEALKELNVELGEKLLPIITPVIEKMTEMIKGFSKLDPNWQMIILGLVFALAILGPIISLITSLTTAWTFAQWLLNAAMAANPIVLIILAIVALIAIVALVIANWDQLSSFFKDLWEKIKTAFTNGVQKAKDTLITWVNGMKAVGKNIVDGIKNGLSDGWSKLVDWLTDKLKALKDKILGIFGIKSPSKWAKEMVGENLVLGLKIGMGNELDNLQSQLPLMLGNTFSGTLSPNASISKNYNPNLNVVVNVEQDSFGNVVSKAKLFGQGTASERLARA